MFDKLKFSTTVSRKAEGVEGVLLITPDFSTAKPLPDKDGRKMVECTGTLVTFRIYEYDENGKHKLNEQGHCIFKDYDIRHHDLKIKLLDGVFYETDNGNYLDYAHSQKT